MSYLAMAEDLVEVEEILSHADGSKGIGNRFEISRSDAIAAIKDGSLKAVGYPYGEVPAEWSGSKKKKVVEVVEDGEHITRTE